MKQKVFTIRRLSWISLLVLVTAISAVSCCNQRQLTQRGAVAEAAVFITEQEVEAAQMAWGAGIVEIGQIYLQQGDYRAAAENHIRRFYAYNRGTVLFKPTLAREQQFRTDFRGALSYFVGGDDEFEEDHGFALKPWRSVRWERTGVKIIGNMAVAMGNYYFLPVNGDEEVKVEYSFAYTKDAQGELRIILHDSHLPFGGAH